jgi:hypothetical protein
LRSDARFPALLARRQAARRLSTMTRADTTTDTGLL